MAEKLVIEIFRTKNTDELTKLLADPDSRLDTGSGAAITASVSSALLVRAAAITAKTVQGNERLDYILRNSEIIRGYMVQLIDEDVKGRSILARAIKEADPQKIEAARHPAVSISAEIVNMMTQSLDFLAELADFCAEEAKQYIAQSADLALATIKCAARYIVDMSSKCSDETFKFITRRENELSLLQYQSVYDSIIEKTTK